MVGRIIKRKRANDPDLQKLAHDYVHNDMLPDTAFIWRAMEWARDDGVIALIVAGRILFKRGDTGAKVRDALFQSMRVTGILNGIALLETWPSLNQPYCILFAQNRKPTPSDHTPLILDLDEPGVAFDAGWSGVEERSASRRK